MNDKIKITEDELFTYYLQQNLWSKGVEFYDLEKSFEEKGVIIIDKRILKNDTE